MEYFWISLFYFTLSYISTNTYFKNDWSPLETADSDRPMILILRHESYSLYPWYQLPLHGVHISQHLSTSPRALLRYYFARSLRSISVSGESTNISFSDFLKNNLTTRAHHLTMQERSTAIRIPIQNSESDYVEIFPDELPSGDLDYNDLIDVLRAEFAPLKIWRSCAVSSPDLCK